MSKSTTSASKTPAKKTPAKSPADADWPACQLMLTVEPGPGAVAVLRAVIETAAPAAVLIRPAPEHNLGGGEVKPLVDLAQQNGAAAIIFGDVKLARTLRADGVHFAASETGDVQALISDARATLGAAASIGVDAGISRHRAMEAGEAGADYIAFGAPEATDLAREARGALIAWWAEIFEIPCVALDVVAADEAAAADARGADFVALTLPAALDAEAALALVGDVDAALMAGG
jgi:thiamine-phosphate pyrophosphorylase